MTSLSNWLSKQAEEFEKNMIRAEIMYPFIVPCYLKLCHQNITELKILLKQQEQSSNSNDT